MQRQSGTNRPKTIQSDAELLATLLPEAKSTIQKLLKSYKQQRTELVKVIAERLAAIKAESSDEMYQYFWRKWLAVTLGEDLQITDGHIARLSRQLQLIKGKATPKGVMTQDLIEKARDIPVESLFNQQFRRSGRNLVGLCPFHDERTPSFHIYTEENRGWGFCCNQGGDSIKLYMLLYDCDFKEAVLTLSGGQL
jgi:hypothetical protein